MPGAGLRGMANRMAAQGRKIILDHGGNEVHERGVEYRLINTEPIFLLALVSEGSELTILGFVH